MSTRRYHDKVSADLTEGVQKFHDGIVPRVGGCFDMWGYVFPILGARFYINSTNLYRFNSHFLLGLEDLFKSVSSSIRLLGSLFSAFLVVKLTGYNLSTSGFSLLIK